MKKPIKSQNKVSRDKVPKKAKKAVKRKRCVFSLDEYREEEFRRIIKDVPLILRLLKEEKMKSNQEGIDHLDKALAFFNTEIQELWEVFSPREFDDKEDAESRERFANRLKDFCLLYVPYIMREIAETFPGFNIHKSPLNCLAGTTRSNINLLLLHLQGIIGEKEIDKVYHRIRQEMEEFGVPPGRYL